ncbi:MAG: SAM-dependent methyltransferase [Stygiobacter sp. RIFOXYC12_FULL_38_8]|nr:MAG: SAM-dependent methyltransferase [Stygiobacter sp. GWC2_38_9]OGU78173.1 MAG: SAM-dependent methyltransferase [Stygiobacter sp. RIFOXYA12_FULL_38_9]OGV07802.1 MAG: SAM-dependent methyltransferase [Stygiobacter sp. RIFOXYB2_FULL_37_11]OGV11667.1 MAG: SAM-dependent methyltransferase [Stygiobacter sp. RIFOXYA2_FULL_38_8]OGV12805.1 MAG: SAM-dependent methyltransferase [Stygiobacter sp. RIFOXYC2_FULL_38_25]OGV27062.1 MAG: SAM-dependent methyltransferase [Stygiobacter sp. RIFOXYC12_FULL_38_8]
MKQWYEELFTNYGNTYDSEVFTTGTQGEVDFIEKEINYDKAKKILDIGCGTGRHSIELAKRGYQVFGFDLSEDQLSKAIEKANACGAVVRFERKDARDFDYNHEFDVGIMLCEGGFSLMETDEMNFSILKNAFNSIKPGGKLIFTTLNGLFPLYHSVKEFINSSDGSERTKNNTFDLMTFRDHSSFDTADDSGVAKHLECNERYYVPPEITWLLKSIGFLSVEIFGARLGEFSRDHKLTTEDFEMLVIATK